jgi:type VI secretion system secreted protein Hcp
VAFDAFLKLSDIKGESTDSKHKDEIQIESFSFGVSNSGSASHGGGAGAGKASFQDFSFVTPLTSASPQLFLACASGKHLKEGLLTIRKSGEKATDFYKVKFSDILISSYQEGGAPDGESAVPMDQISFNFAKIEISYTRQNDKGGAGEETKAGWDTKEGRAT